MRCRMEMDCGPVRSRPFAAIVLVCFIAAMTLHFLDRTSPAIVVLAKETFYAERKIIIVTGIHGGRGTGAEA